MWYSERKKLLCGLMLLCAVCLLDGCVKEECGMNGRRTESVEASIMPAGIRTRASDPDEWKINDVNFLVYDDEGKLYFSRYAKAGGASSCTNFTFPLAHGVRTSIAVCANFGYEMKHARTLDELRNARHYLAYADELRNGIPMCRIVSGVWEEDTKRMEIRLERLMSKISVSIDRSCLNPGVLFDISAVSLHNIPRSCALACDSKAADGTEVFRTPLRKKASEADALNIGNSMGKSREVSFLMFENMQGELLEDTVDDSGKVLDGPHSKVCSYIEIEIEYSDRHKADGKLIYRFYPGESNSSFDIRRNSRYRYSIVPVGDGLGDDGWRIDKSRLEFF